MGQCTACDPSSIPGISSQIPQTLKVCVAAANADAVHMWAMTCIVICVTDACNQSLACLNMATISESI